MQRFCSAHAWIVSYFSFCSCQPVIMMDRQKGLYVFFYPKLSLRHRRLTVRISRHHPLCSAQLSKIAWRFRGSIYFFNGLFFSLFVLKHGLRFPGMEKNNFRGEWLVGSFIYFFFSWKNWAVPNRISDICQRSHVSDRSLYRICNGLLFVWGLLICGGIFISTRHVNDEISH